MQHAQQRTALAIYTATICLSAFLLFSVQPLFVKMLLPKLGGSPAVWAVSLCFFQTVLVAGYAYAHLLEHRLRPKPALMLHAALWLAAIATLPIWPPTLADATPPEKPYIYLLGILGLGVGLPFFALSANAPLLQAWFARSDLSRDADPYSLYAASNAGSLAALLAYPSLIEPLVPLTSQSRTWAVGFLLLGAMIVACYRFLPKVPPPHAPRATVWAALPSQHARRWRDRLVWASLAFVPSALLIAFTTYLSTDIASVPLLWVMPLALYLATFIAVFRPRPPIGRGTLLAVQAVSVAVTIVTKDWDAGFAWALSCAAGTIAFAATGLVCHRQLYDRRPEPARLTDFYLWMSLGGAPGGVFAALIAPQAFTNLLELPLLLGLGMVCAAGWRPAEASGQGWGAVSAVFGALAAVVVLAAASSGYGLIAWTPQLRFYALVALGVMMLATWRWRALQLGATAVLVLGDMLLPDGNRALHVARSFFGTHRVVEPPGGTHRLLLHGTTLHGAQRIEDPRRPGLRPLPLTYYHPSGPLARGMLLARDAAGGPSQPLRVGIVGLGAGAMACHALPGDRWRFFEIDAEVVRIASTPAYFTYLVRCQPDAGFVLGDARLTLAREPEAAFDYLAIDAFSSDAIPLHLLTVEALRLYAGRLAERGVLALHVSNQNLDLPPIIESNLAHVPGLAGIYAQGESGQGAIRSQVVLIAKHADILAPALAWPKSRALAAPSVRPWTDDYSDVLTPLIRRYRSRLAGE
jgi:hypothetical protein